MTINISGEEYNNTISVQSLYGPKGEKGEPGLQGEQGKSIVSIEKTLTFGNDDTYTITFSDGTTQNFSVHNGADAVIEDATISSKGVVKLADFYEGAYGFYNNEDVATIGQVLEAESRYLNNCVIRHPKLNLMWQSWYFNQEQENLTLLSGSQYYKTNGTKNYDLVDLVDDISLEFNGGFGIHLVFPTNNSLISFPYSDCYCREEQPDNVSENSVWYNKTNDILYVTTDSGNTWSEADFGLPVAQIESFDFGDMSIRWSFEMVGFIENTVFYPKDTVVSLPCWWNNMTGLCDGPLVIFNEHKLFTIQDTTKPRFVTINEQFEAHEYDNVMQGSFPEQDNLHPNNKILYYSAIDNCNSSVETNENCEIMSSNPVIESFLFEVGFDENGFILYVNHVRPIDLASKAIANYNQLGLVKGCWKSEEYDREVAVDLSGRLWSIGFDEEPIENSSRGITSGAVFNVLGNIEAILQSING